MSTIKPILMLRKVWSISLATLAADDMHIPRGEDDDGDIVFPNLAQCVVIIIVGQHIFGPLISFVEERLSSNVFGPNGTDPVRHITTGIRHSWQHGFQIFAARM
jgi:hypothetical protein